MHHFLKKQLIHCWWSHDLWISVVVLVQDFIERLRLLDHRSVLWSYVSRSWWGWGVARDSEFQGLHQLAVAQNLKHQNWCLEDLMWSQLGSHCGEKIGIIILIWIIQKGFDSWVLVICQRNMDFIRDPQVETSERSSKMMEQQAWGNLVLECSL